MIRPLSGWRLLFTYVVPVLPLLVLWDGIVSCLRTYKPAELLAMTTGLDRFSWEAGELRARGAFVTYLVGEPRVGADVYHRRDGANVPAADAGSR